MSWVFQSQCLGFVAWHCSWGFILYFIRDRPHSYTCHFIHSVHFQAAYRVHQSWQHLDGYSKHGTFPWSTGSGHFGKTHIVAALTKPSPMNPCENEWKVMRIVYQNQAPFCIKAAKAWRLAASTQRQNQETFALFAQLSFKRWCPREFTVTRAFLKSKECFLG